MSTLSPPLLMRLHSETSQPGLPQSKANQEEQG
jgi:hypothetical protein